MGGKRVGDALFVIREERLDGRCVSQCAVERIEGVKAVFGAAGLPISLDRGHGAARERRYAIYVFMHRHLGIGTSNARICRRRRCRFRRSTSVSNHLWRFKKI